MAKRKAAARQRPVEISDDEEWIAIRFPMPAYVTGEGEPYRPEVSMWLSSDCGILASELYRPGDPAVGIGETLRQALEQPLVGPPRRPARIRVADEALVPAIRAVTGESVAVRVAPTPEADLMRSLMAEMPGGGGTQIPYTADVPPETLAGFHRAAARLYRAAPWKIIEDEDLVFGVRAPSLGLPDGCAVFIGQLGESFGALLFDSLEAYRRFRSACEEVQGDLDEAPPTDLDLGARVFSINFERGADLPPPLKRLIKERGLEVGGPRGYPVIGLLDPDRTPRPVGGADVALGWACAAALARFVEAHGPALGGLRAPVRERYTLDEMPGAPEVEVRAPRPGAVPEPGEVVDEAIDDLIGAFRAAQKKDPGRLS